MQENWQCRWSPTIGELEGTHQDAWGTVDYVDKEKPTCFFGLYGLSDFYALWSHKGKRAILWAGSDILHFTNGYWLNGIGSIKLEHYSLAEWINSHCESYVENEVEYHALKAAGVEAKIVPSFLGKIDDYKIEYKQKKRPKVYASVSGNDFELYKWPEIERVAELVPEVDFYLYGNMVEWKSENKNVFVRGRILKEEMNKEVSKMQCGFRPLEFDGCSEIIVKSALWGQHPISRINYPFVSSYRKQNELLSLLRDLKNKKEPNLKARDWFINNLNNFPWNSKKIDNQ